MEVLKGIKVHDMRFGGGFGGTVVFGDMRQSSIITRGLSKG